MSAAILCSESHSDVFALLCTDKRSKGKEAKHRKKVNTVPARTAVFTAVRRLLHKSAYKNTTTLTMAVIASAEHSGQDAGRGRLQRHAVSRPLLAARGDHVHPGKHSGQHSAHGATR